LNLRYANLFWVAPDKNVYLANGYHGQRIFVIPALDIVAVATGTGHSATIGKEIEMIADAVKSDAPLPPDTAGQSLLASRIQEVATEKPSPVGETSKIAKTISGKIYRFSDNPLRLSALALNLDGPNPSYKYELRAGRPDAPVERFEGPIGLDGVYRAGVPTDQGITVAKGAWSSDQSFVVQFEELGGDNLRKAILSFRDNAVDLVFIPEHGPSVDLHGEASD
jgi:hypothetical protein